MALMDSCLKKLQQNKDVGKSTQTEATIKIVSIRTG